MKYELRTTNSKGFSLTEVLLAVGILAVGTLFIAGTFLVGIHFSTIATEQTIAAVAADEAFAKIKIYGVNLADPNLQLGNLLVPFEKIVLINPLNPDEFAYPSTNTVTEKQYYWSALCRGVDPNTGLVQVTVFVCRKVGPVSARPVPVQVGISAIGGIGNEKKLKINVAAEETFINDGYTIVDNQTGQIYRVLERDASQPDRIILDRPWLGGATGFVWVVPPPVGSGRNPCIAVYPKVMRF